VNDDNPETPIGGSIAPAMAAELIVVLAIFAAAIFFKFTPVASILERFAS
jgi:hypothetical protein